jgi:5'-nucleotidase
MTNRSLVVALDVDEVLANLMSEWLRRYNHEYDDTLIPEDITGWDISAHTKCPDKFHQYLYAPNLYKHVTPLLGTRPTVDAIRAAGHRVVFATSCTQGSEADKLAWLRRWGFAPHATLKDAMRDFYPCSDKSVIRADALFDDGVHNVEAFPSHAFLVDHPHNRRTPCTRPRIRFSDWPRVLFQLNRISNAR